MDNELVLKLLLSEANQDQYIALSLAVTEEEKMEIAWMMTLLMSYYQHYYYPEEINDESITRWLDKMLTIVNPSFEASEYIE